jgi:DNA-binding GntR family transcriptional regulator
VNELIASRRAPIRRHSLHEAVVDRLRDMVVEGHFGGGQRLNESVLAEQLGVSRTPVREAIKLLVSEGLLVLSPGRGARVRVMPASEVLALFEVISGLERQGAELAAARMRPRELERIERMHAQMAEVFAHGDLHEYFRLNHGIHSLVMDLAHNPMLKAIHASLLARARFGRYNALMSAERWREAMAEHELLIDALRRRDASEAGRIMARHTSRTGESAARAAAREVRHPRVA